MIKPWFVFIHFIHHTLHWLNFACIFSTKVKSYNQKIKKPSERTKWFCRPITSWMLSAIASQRFGIVSQTMGPYWKRCSDYSTVALNFLITAIMFQLATLCQGFFHGLEELIQFTSASSMRICHYSEGNSPSLSGHLNALKCSSKWLILKTFLLNFFEFFSFIF